MGVVDFGEGLGEFGGWGGHFRFRSGRVRLYGIGMEGAQSIGRSWRNQSWVNSREGWYIDPLIPRLPRQ